MALRRASFAGSAKTMAASLARWTLLFESRIDVPNSRRTSSSAGRPGSMNWRARESASSTSKRNSRSMAATADLPVAMPPVRPRRSIISPRAGDGLRGFARELSAAELGSFYRVAHEHGNGHGADAAGYGSERASSVDRVGVHVTN